MSLATMTSAARVGDTVTIEPGWGQGRATFGGVVAAVLLARLRGLLSDPVPLRTVTTFLLAPVAPGPVQLDARVLRRGSAVTVAEVALRQEGLLAATAQAAFGAPRTSGVEVPAGTRIDRPAVPEPMALPGVGTGPGVPEFYRHVEIRLASGAAPFSGAAEPDFGGWMRYLDPVDLTVEHVVALADAWPPAVTTMLPGPAPSSTLSWTFDLLAEPDPADTWLQYRVRTDSCRDGYGHTTAHLWGADGRPLAVSRQTVTVFG